MHITNNAAADIEERDNCGDSNEDNGIWETLPSKVCSNQTLCIAIIIVHIG